MTFRKLAAVALIFLGTSAGWSVLGASVVNRTGEYDSALEREVRLLWGGPHRQVAPRACVRRPGFCDAISLDATRAAVDLNLEHRRKGLLWYPVAVRPVQDVSKDMTATITAGPGAVTTLDVQYRSRGLRAWTYAFAPDGISDVREFQLTMETNFRDIDFPVGTVSPDERRDTAEGVVLDWRFTHLITGQNVGMAMPEKLNPGPFAARVTFFAPVSLLFFLTVMVIVGATHGPSLHPMHYWFIACAFFAFHLLLAYLVDHISIHAAFPIAAVVSLALVFSYLRVVTGAGRALWWAVSAQAVFLVLFSYAFFFEGYTGLTITIGAIVTLFLLMQITARVSWDELFASKELHHASRV